MPSRPPSRAGGVALLCVGALFCAALLVPDADRELLVGQGVARLLADDLERFETSPADPGTLFAAVDALLRPARDLDALGLLDAWDFLEARFFGNLDAELAAHVGGLRCGVYRLFCVTAVRDGQRHSATA